MTTEKEVRALVSRAIRLTADDASLGSFGPHEKTVIDNLDFLCWLVKLAQADEREACAKVVERYCGAWSDEGYALAAAIRARGNT